MTQLLRISIASACLLMAAGSAPSAGAAAPDAKSLFPRGGAVGSTVEVTVAGKLSADTQVWCSQTGLTFEVPESAAQLKVTIAADAPTGLCWIRLFNNEGATSLLPFVVGRLSEVTETEPNNALAESAAGELPRLINGKLEKGGDVDSYAVALQQGQTLVAEIDANWRLNSPVDPVLQIVSPQGIVDAQNDDARGFDPRLVFTAPSNGTWHVRVFGFPATPNSSIAFSGSADHVYRLMLSTSPIAHHVMPHMVSRGMDSAVTVAGWNLSEALRAPVNVTGDAASFQHPELPDPAVLLAVDGPVIHVAEPCDRQQSIALAVGSHACGVIDQPGDEDAFKFTAAKGDKLLIRAVSQNDGYPLDPVLRMFDAAGKQLAEADDEARDKADAALKFTAPADGDYMLVVTDLFENGGWDFVYRLSVEPLKASLDLTVAADHFVLTADKPLEIPVTIARNDGFAEEVNVTVDSLPEGVTSEVVKSEAKGDSSKSVKLMLKSERAEAFNAPIRIVGTWGDNQRTQATTALSFPVQSTSDIWLTVVPKPAAAAEEKPQDGDNKPDQG